MNDRIAVLGAGAWGTALAVLLARGGRRVTLCARRAEQCDAIRVGRENSAYLPGVAIPDQLRLSADWSGVVRNADTVVMTVPSRHARASLIPVTHEIRPGTLLVSATKGVEEDTLFTMSAMISAVAPPGTQIAVLSGPGFAAEVARGKPAALVAAAQEESIAIRTRELFASRTLRVYSSTDVVGVELAGAAKNVIAIAVGASDGLELGSSARAAVITRGLAEIMRLTAAGGGRRETIAGLAGLGDLVLTCTGDLSRNRSVGLRLGRGERPDVQSDRAGKPVAEGIANARSVRALAARLGVEMPIVDGV
ncbi:MAG TPA: NAD(P)H-dependent glycerol-3-phosphate dehydrogenase, partial [Candidatus Binataceae bacterium]|nr:NAD(P)H-dependent glycerol-3-phosphate dehydrogenase [Candidatus Binataceae bacterium]